MSTPMMRLSESSSSNPEAEVETLPSTDHNSRKNTCRFCVKSPRKRILLLCVFIAVLASGVGALIGYFVPLALKSSCLDISSASEDVHDTFADEVSTKELENNLR